MSKFMTFIIGGGPAGLLPEYILRDKRSTLLSKKGLSAATSQKPKKGYYPGFLPESAAWN
jgi:hypothetical protein